MIIFGTVMPWGAPPSCKLTTQTEAPTIRIVPYPSGLLLVGQAAPGMMKVLADMRQQLRQRFAPGSRARP